MKYDSNFIGTLLQKNISDLIASYSVNEYDKLIFNTIQHRDTFAIIVEDYNMGKILGRESYISGKIRDADRNVIDYDFENAEQNKQLEESYYSDKYNIASSSGEILGSINIYISNQSMISELNQIITGTLINTITISLLLVLSLFITIRFFILRPISNIISVISKRDNHGIPIELITAHGSKEILTLSNTMNSMIHSIRDSRIKLTEQNNELKAHEDQLSLQVTALQAVADGVVITDKYGIIQWVNPSFEKITGYRFDEVLGKNPRMLQSGRQDQSFYQQLWQTILSGKTWLGELYNKHKDGSIYLELESITPVLDENGEIRHFVAIKRDITAHRQQEEQLHRSQKMDALGKLTGGIAHDYNNMLGIVLGYAELLENKLSDNPKLAKYASEIHHAGERGSKLTRKLLLFSRKQATEAEAVDINALLRDARLMLEKTLTVRIKLVMDLVDDLWPVWLDGSDLEDAVLNMSINAMHAMPDGGQLTLATSKKHLNVDEAKILGLAQADYVVLSLTDTGMGMDETIRKQIFDPFFSTKGNRGTGLGLSQVYGFVQRTKGAIKVYSEPGHGSRFALYFPRHQDKGSESIAAQPVTETDLSGHETILVVDDEPGLRDLAQEILAAQGYKVLSAENGEQALTILETKSVDLLLSDVIMPGMDGYQLAAKVREHYPAVKIQLASGFSDNRHQDAVDDDLHQGMLHKPFSSQELLQRLRTLLDAV